MSVQHRISISNDQLESVNDLQKQVSEDEITIKGYVNKLRNIIEPFIDSNGSEELSLIEKQFEDEELTEKGFYKQCKKLFDSFEYIVKDELKESKEPLVTIPRITLSKFLFTKDKENNQNVENGSYVDSHISNINGNDEIEITEKLSESIQQMDFESKTEVPNDFDQPSESAIDISSTKLCNTPNLKKKCKQRKFQSQPLISSSFTAVFKRSDSEMTEISTKSPDSSPEGKRKRMEEKEDKTTEEKPVLPTQTAPISRRCQTCSQLLNFEELKLYPGHPEGAVEEFVALTDPKLSLFTGEEDSIHEYDQRPQHKITSFNIYDKEGHLCPFDGGLIERNVLLYFSGYLKPIYEENPSLEDGIPAKEMGPINEWWISGFDGGEKALIGFSTAFAEYILMEPSETYASFFEAVQEKIYMSKLVIELLVNIIEPSYEDLLLKVQTAVPPPGIPSFTEDSLLRHAQFICDQVNNFDQALDEGEESLISSSCMYSLMTLAGVTLDKKGKSRHRGGRIKVEKKMPKFTLATTTPLVRNLFESFFADQIAIEKSSQIQGPRRVRCGVCEVCQESDCGSCRACRDMVKFGGTGRSKQCCINRRCPNMAVAEIDESDGEEELRDLKLDSSSQKPAQKTHAVKKKSYHTKWVCSSVAKEGKRTYYGGVEVERDLIEIGDCVMVEPDDPKTPVYIARVRALWEVTGRGDKMFHADWFCRGIDTILGETADPYELFLVNDCEDTLLDAVLKKVTVIEELPRPNWIQLGGIEDPEIHYPIKEKNDHTYFYQKLYNADVARFEDVPPRVENKDDRSYKQCQSCLRIKEEEAREMCLLGTKADQVEGSLNQYTFGSIDYLGYKFEVGDCAYVNPEAFRFKIRPSAPSNGEKKRSLDETLYPEFYRKTSDRVKGSNADTPEPFRIVRILKIMCKDAEMDLVSPDDVRLRVAKFYRPENTHRGQSASFQADLNILYWSEEEVTMNMSSVCGQCSVVFRDNLQCSVDEFFSNGPNRFIFLQSYDSDLKEFGDPPQSALLIGGVAKGKGKGKGKTKEKSTRKEVKLETHPVISERLRCLDVFAGCGGLSEGMHAAGVTVSNWAIEVYEPAAQAFRLNNPDAVVFTDDCNHLLKLAIEGTEKNEKGQRIPQKGEVEMLCGGPPCQGFSGMNRFNSRQYSQFKNSLVASYLSYCDFYRPKYFILENVRNFVSYKCSMVLKLTLRVLLKMGYQCTVGVLQAGSYGVSQTRRRAIIMAAAPGEVLPLYPEPLNTFSPRACQVSLAVDGKRYASNCKWVSSAPLRTITVRDAMSDLPDIKNGARKDQISYGSEPESHFQRLIRGVQDQPILRDHICKDMAALIEARMRNIPTASGSDWRDLPNISIRLSDGKFSKVLVYSHPDKKNGRSSTGALRGVCSCMSGKPCDPMDKQFNTLIPWCLPHTGNRHNHWAGLYGRLEWDGFFSTTVTNPEPMGKQGRVLHPEQNRVVSVRECARSQGFPDTYRFYGSVLEKHRQVGNAVPPPMAKAIGQEIKKAMQKKEQKITEA